MQSMTMPIFDVCWNGDGTKVFMASSNNHVESWDLERNQTMLVATHDAPVISCHWVVASPYTCIMTGSWDGTLKVCHLFCFVKYLDTRRVNGQMGNALLYVKNSKI